MLNFKKMTIRCGFDKFPRERERVKTSMETSFIMQLVLFKCISLKAMAPAIKTEYLNIRASSVHPSYYNSFK